MKLDWMTRHRLMMLALLVLTLVTVACGGAGGVADPSDEATGAPGELPTPINGTLGSTETTAGASEAIANEVRSGIESWGDLCSIVPTQHSYMVEIGLLDESDLAGLIVAYDPQAEGFWTYGSLGADGAWATGAQLTDETWLCDLDVTEDFIVALASANTPAEIEAAIQDHLGGPGADDSAGDSDGGASNGGIDVMSPSELRQLARDLLNASGRAEQLGDLESAEEFKSEARDVYEGYGETIINDSSDVRDLMSVQAGAELLGLDELREAAADKIDKELLDELEDAGELFTPCTTDPNVIRIYFDIYARVTLVVRDYVSDGKASAWIEAQEKRANGEDVDECDGGVLFAEQPLDGWDGTLVVQLGTCGFTHWEGNAVASGTLEVDGGTMALEGSIPLDLRGEPATGDFAGEATFTLTTSGGSGTGSTVLYGTGYLEWTDSQWELTLFFSPGTFDMTIEAGGATINQSRSIDWGEKTLVGEVTPVEGSCK